MYIFLLAFHLISAIAIVGFNALALYIIGNTPKMRTPQHLYRMNLAVADILLGISFFLPSIYFATKRFFFQEQTIIGTEVLANSTDEGADQIREVNIFVAVVGFLSWLSVSVSFLTLVAASFDRVVATVSARRYIKNAQKKITMVVCIVIWVIVAGATVVAAIKNQYGLDGPFFVMPVDQEFSIHIAIASLVMLGLMFINSSIVMTKLYLHNRYVYYEVLYFINILIIL